MHTVTWQELDIEAERIANTWRDKVDSVYGIPTGGVPLALMVAHKLNVPIVNEWSFGRVLTVDDLVDTGRTMGKYANTLHDAGFRKPWTPKELAPNAREIDEWLWFPWEHDAGDPHDAVVRMLQFIGENPTRDGLRDTPKRVCKAMKEMTAGYDANIAEILSVSFDVAYDSMVVLRNVPFHSLCEHHMLPFTGTATIGYVPRERVVGLSKLARLLEAFATRLQVQERLTMQIVDALEQHLQPLGCGVVIMGEHMCMSCRGVRKHGEMVTSALRGVLYDKPEARAEFLALAGAATN